MTATKVGAQSLQANAPTVTMEFLPDSGEEISWEWSGSKVDTEAKYQSLKTAANLVRLSHKAQNGRGSIVARFGRQGNVHDIDTGYGPDVTVVEELYAIELIKDVWNAPAFVSGTYALTDVEATLVRKVADLGLSVADIDVEVRNGKWGAGYLYAGWSAAMKQLHYHMIHGHESYREYSYVFRRSKYGARTAQINEVLTGINAVATGIVFSSSMQTLVDALPTGQWMKGPASVEQYEKGKWRTSEMYEYAPAWSKVYTGGTWGL
jgi:hypothetical protein